MVVPGLWHGWCYSKYSLENLAPYNRKGIKAIICNRNSKTTFNLFFRFKVDMKHGRLYVWLTRTSVVLNIKPEILLFGR